MLRLSGVVVSARARGEQAGVTRTALPVRRRGPIVGTLAAHWLPAAAGPRSPPADTKRVQDGGGGRGEPARRGRGAAGAARGAGIEPAPPSPLPRRQPGRDAAAALLEPQGQVQLHRPLAGQPARPLQRCQAGAAAPGSASARSGTAPAWPSARPLRGARRARAEPAAGPAAPGQGRREQCGDGRCRALVAGRLLGPGPRLGCSGRAAWARERRRWGAGGSPRQSVWPYITLCGVARPGPVQPDRLFTLASCLKRSRGVGWPRHAA